MNKEYPIHPIESEPDSPVALAISLRPLLERFAAQCEAERKVPDDVLAALKQSGLFNLVKPRRTGGGGHSMATWLEVSAELGKGCVGSAWAYTILSSVTGRAAALPRRISGEIFKTGEELVCGVSTPSGQALAVDGGYMLSGRWPYASGCMHAQWALCATTICDTEGQKVDTGMVVVPVGAEGLAIEDTWHVAGVCGSGSHTLVATDLFVPTDFVLKFSAMPSEAEIAAMPGIEARDRWPAEPLFALNIIGPLFGPAQAVLEAIVAKAGQRGLPYWLYASQSESDVVLEHIGQAATEISAAWQLVMRCANDMDDVAQRRLLTFEERARIQAECGYAVFLLRSATDRLMDIAGASAFASQSPLQRLWRDLNVGSRHGILNSRPSLELFGRALTDRPSNNQFFRKAP